MIYMYSCTAYHIKIYTAINNNNNDNHNNRPGVVREKKVDGINEIAMKVVQQWDGETENRRLVSVCSEGERESEVGLDR